MSMLARFFGRGKRTEPVGFGAGGGRWMPTHRHRKGGLYRLIGHGVNEADRQPVAIYDDESGTVWVRSRVEFEDGRFAPINV